MAIQQEKTLLSLLHRTLTERGDQPAIWLFRDDCFQSRTWADVGKTVRRYAHALAELRVKPGDRVVQISENRYEWLALDLAIHVCQAVHVALHATLTGPQLAAQIADCEPTLIVVSSAAQAAKLQQVAAHLPLNIPIWSHDLNCPAVHNSPVASFDDFAHTLDLEDPRRGEDLLETALAHTKPGTLATILYTSGTTGEAKGVMLSHGNLTSNAVACVDAFAGDAQNLRLCWLPLSHIYARTSDLYVWMAAGSQMALARSRDTLIADLALVRPTFVNGVPYFYDKLYQHVRDAGKVNEPGVLKALLGGQIRVCCAGGAALSDETARFFERQGVLLVQGYGLTEASPVITTGTRAAHRIGTVGPALPGVEIRIADDGEVLTRGPHVMLGYWRKPQATGETIRNGWLHTGDLGVLEDGFLRITGRKKEILVLSSGKNIAPALLERLLCDDPLIAQVMVLGDGRNYLTALIVPDPNNLKSQISNLKLPITSPAEALADPTIQSLYRECITARLTDLSPQEQIGKFTLVSRAFSIELGELTPTLKLRRATVAEHFAAEIAAMYA